MPYVHVSDTALTVKDVFRDGACDINRLATPLPPPVSQNLASMCVHTRASQNDLLVWTASQDGVYTVSGCYAWLQARFDEESLLVPWAWIWRAFVPEKVRVFAWQALHNLLPVAAILARRGVPLNDRCRLCNLLPESHLHCLRKCSSVVQVWHNLALSLSPGFFEAGSVEEWLSSVPREHAAAVLVHAWCIWRRRCSLVFGDSLEPWPLVWQHAVGILRVLQIEHGNTVDHRWVAWRAPPAGWFALNVDGSSLSNPGRAGAG